MPIKQKNDKIIPETSSQVDAMVRREIFDAAIRLLSYSASKYIFDDEEYKKMINNPDFADSFKRDINLIKKIRNA